MKASITFSTIHKLEVGEVVTTIEKAPGFLHSILIFFKLAPPVKPFEMRVVKVIDEYSVEVEPFISTEVAF